MKRNHKALATEHQYNKTRQAILLLAEAGVKSKDIAASLNLGRSTVARVKANDWHEHKAKLERDNTLRQQRAVNAPNERPQIANESDSLKTVLESLNQNIEWLGSKIDELTESINDLK